jgi:hypothetical protein
MTAARYSAVTGALASVSATAQLHHVVGQDHKASAILRNELAGSRRRRQRELRSVARNAAPAARCVQSARHVGVLKTSAKKCPAVRRAFFNELDSNLR